jgi:hypothetical protein
MKHDQLRNSSTIFLRKIIFGIVLLLPSFSFAQFPGWAWANSAGGISFDYPTKIACDLNGNVVITGYFESPSITFGSVTLVNTLASGNSDDLFLAKYNSQGQLLWARTAGGTNDDEGSSVATDASGNSYVTGHFVSDTIWFGSTYLTQTAAGAAFVAKYDPAGNLIWARTVGTANPSDICTDPNGTVFVTGSFSGASLTFGSSTITNNGSSNVFIFRYDTAGNEIWARAAGGAGADYGFGIYKDSPGNLYITGTFGSPSVTFGSTILTQSGSDDIFLAKYDNNGNVLWAKKAGGSFSDGVYGISGDVNGNIFLSGNFYSPAITFGSTTLVNSTSSSFDAFIAKYDSNGNELWAKGMAGFQNELAGGVVADNNGNCFVAGYFSSPYISFGTDSLQIFGAYNSFFAEYDPNGNVLGVKGSQNSMNNSGYLMCKDINDNLFAAGTFFTSFIMFDSDTLYRQGYTDIYLAKLDNPASVPETMEIAGPSVYPDPNNGVFMISGLNEADCKIEILNITGDAVPFRINQKDNYSEIDLSGNAAGIYFVRINTGKKIYSEKIIKAE